MADTDNIISGAELLAIAEHGERGAGEFLARTKRGCFLAEKQGKGQNAWYIYVDGIWVPDKFEDVPRFLCELQTRFYDEISLLNKGRGKSKAEDKTIDEKIRVLERAALRLDKQAFVKNAVLYAAQGKDSLAFDGSRFDQKKNLIPCPNGILDPSKCSITDGGKIQLDTKSAFRGLRPEDYVRHTCTSFNKDADCPKWEAFLADVLDGNTEDGREVISFLQTLIGYILLGDPCQDIHVILYSANGRSGKGVFCKLLLKVFGGMGVTTKSALFEKKPSGGDPNRAEPAIMALKNKRLVVMSEQSKGAVYDAAEVKTKTSGRDEVTARALYGEQESFLPSYTFVQETNTMPRVDADDGAFWARLIRIEFPYTYVREPNPGDPSQKLIDTGLEARLETELPGILNWCIIGAIKYIQAGYRLPTYPKLVRAAIDEYRQHEDSLSEFLSDCCLMGEGYETQSSALYAAYQKWSDQSGRRPCSKIRFKDGLKRKNITDVHTNKGTFFRGVGLIQAA